MSFKTMASYITGKRSILWLGFFFDKRFKMIKGKALTDIPEAHKYNREYRRTSLAFMKKATSIY